MRGPDDLIRIKISNTTTPQMVATAAASTRTTSVIAMVMALSSAPAIWFSSLPDMGSHDPSSSRLRRLFTPGTSQLSRTGGDAEGSTSDELGPFLAGVGPRGSDELSSLRTGLEGPSSRPSTLQNLNFTVRGRVQRVSCGYTHTRGTTRNGKHIGKILRELNFAQHRRSALFPCPYSPTRT